MYAGNLKLLLLGCWKKGGKKRREEAILYIIRTIVLVYNTHHSILTANNCIKILTQKKKHLNLNFVFVLADLPYHEIKISTIYYSHIRNSVLKYLLTPEIYLLLFST